MSTCSGSNSYVLPGSGSRSVRAATRSGSAIQQPQPVATASASVPKKVEVTTAAAAAATLPIAGPPFVCAAHSQRPMAANSPDSSGPTQFSKRGKRARALVPGKNNGEVSICSDLIEVWKLKPGPILCLKVEKNGVIQSECTSYDRTLRGRCDKANSLVVKLRLDLTREWYQAGWMHRGWRYQEGTLIYVLGTDETRMTIAECMSGDPSHQLPHQSTSLQQSGCTAAVAPTLRLPQSDSLPRSGRPATVSAVHQLLHPATSLQLPGRTAASALQLPDAFAFLLQPPTTPTHSASHSLVPSATSRAQHSTKRSASLLPPGAAAPQCTGSQSQGKTHSLDTTATASASKRRATSRTSPAPSATSTLQREMAAAAARQACASNPHSDARPTGSVNMPPPDPRAPNMPAPNTLAAIVPAARVPLRVALADDAIVIQQKTLGAAFLALLKALNIEGSEWMQHYSMWTSLEESQVTNFFTHLYGPLCDRYMADDKVAMRGILQLLMDGKL